MTSHDFGVLLGLAYQGFVDQLHAHLAANGITRLGPAYGYVVRALDAEPGLHQRDLAERLGITAQGAGKIIDEMVRKKFVARRRDPVDARARCLELGPRGKELLRLARDFHATFERDLGPRAAIARALLEKIVASSSDATAQGRLRAT